MTSISRVFAGRFRTLRERQRLQIGDALVVFVQILLCHLLNLFRGDLIDPVDIFVDDAPAQTHGLGHAQLHGLVEIRVTLINLARHNLGLHALEFVRGHLLLLKPRNLLDQGLFEIGDGSSLHGRALEHEQCLETAVEIVAGAGSGGDLLAAHQPTRQTRAVSAVEDARSHFQCVRFPGLFDGAQHRGLVADHDIGKLRRNLRGHPPRTQLLDLLLRLHRRQLARF